MTADTLRVVSLFAGAGGIDEGVAQACEAAGHAPGETVELHAINHWEPAIETHERNHPWAEHYHARIEELYPPDVVEPGTVTLLVAGPECTHFSNARGGKPVSDQKRASAWHVLDWIEKLRPEYVLLENVKEFRSWGPIDEDDQPTKDGTIFQRWIGVLQSLGYTINYDDDADDYGVVLNAADYGDPQSRERLFIMASRSTMPTRPPQTHSDDPDDDLPPRRPAAEIIDWSDLGNSLWTRDLEDPRVTPLSENTMARIAEGIRRHCSDRLSPFADAIERIGPDELEQLREHVVPAQAAPYVAAALDEPFLVRSSGGQAFGPGFITRYYGTNYSSAIDEPIGTITAGGNKYGLASPAPFLLGQHSGNQARDMDRPAPTVTAVPRIGLCSPEAFCLRQQSGGVPVPVTDPLSTVAGGGAISLTTVESRTLLQPRNGAYGGPDIAYDPHERPHHTVIASDTRQGHLLTPSLVRYSHGGAALRVDDPMPTIATEKGGTFALSSPYLCPLYPERRDQRPRTRAVDRPLMSVPASKSPAAVATPFIDCFEGAPRPVSWPLGTITGADRYALCVPDVDPLLGLDVRYRMLQPDELKQAQGFPPEYEIAGSTKRTRTKLIGNAVPVNLARALVAHLLADETPSLASYGGGLQEDPDAEVPAYAEVSQSDD